MTNRNYRVTTMGADYVVRLSVRESGELGHRPRERASQLGTRGQAGVGAPVIARVEDPEALVVQFVDGVTLTPADFRDPRRVSALPATLGACTQRRRSRATSTWRQVQRRYLEIVAENGYPLPGRLRPLRRTRPADVRRPDADARADAPRATTT